MGFAGLMCIVVLGTVRFTVADGTLDAPQGSMMVVPPRAAHMFSNPSETEEAELYMTANPGELVSCQHEEARAGAPSL